MNQLIPVGQEWSDIKNMSSVLVKSNFLPKSVDTPEKACAIMLMARELGCGPMEGFSQINVILGKPTQSPQMMKARVHAKLPKAIFRQIESTDKVARFEAARPGDPVQTYSFTIEEARALGLENKDNWKKQPATMLVWRCIGKVARQVFPDCLSGISYSPEELGASVNEEGEVIDVKPTTTPTATTVKQIHAEAKAEQTGKKREALQKEIIAAMKELGEIGFKEQEIFAQLNIKQYADLNKEDEKGLEAALSVLTQLALR